MKVLVIAWTNLVRTLRDARGLFFIAVLPMILIVVLGMIYGGNGTARVGVLGGASGPLASDLVAELEQSDLRPAIRTYATRADLQDAVERGYVEIGVVIPGDFDATLAGGGTAAVEYIAQPISVASAVRTSVDQAVADEAALVAAARSAASENGIPFETAYAAARSQRTETRAVSTQLSTVGDLRADVTGYTLGAQSQLILFMFLSALTAALALIVTRDLGISRRMFATPTAASTIILGEAAGRFVISLSQGVFIVLFSWLVFDVDWVDPLATSAIVVAFALVATGAAMAIGAFSRNAHQASSLAPGLGMMLGLIGGCMVPPEIFPPAMQTISHLTPHAWAIDGFRELVLHGGGITTVLPEIAVLLGFAAVLIGLAVVRFRQVLVTGAA
jgi:linearmycin/streptolysin S transport system permease protein